MKSTGNAGKTLSEVGEITIAGSGDMNGDDLSIFILFIKFSGIITYTSVKISLLEFSSVKTLPKRLSKQNKLQTNLIYICKSLLMPSLRAINVYKNTSEFL